MPSWQPDWTDVVFDHAVAGVYALACDEASREVHRWVDRREAAARRAAEHWEGPHRVSFDHRLAALHQQARAAAVRLAQDAAAARQASALATREQDHREAERRRWYAEQAWEEEQARQEAARQQAAAQAAGGVRTPWGPCSMTVSANPRRLQAYVAEAGQARLAVLTRRDEVERQQRRYQAACRAFPGPTGAGLATTDVALAETGSLDRWVGDVAAWFDAADRGTLGSITPDSARAVAGPLMTMRPGWPAPAVVGWDVLGAPRQGSWAVAGYGPGCSGPTTWATSVLGPDGFTYPVVVPGAAGTDQESLDYLPTAQGADADGRVDDTGRAWSTTLFSEAVVGSTTGNWDRLAGAIAATGGWSPVRGASLSGDSVGRVLRVGPTGMPALLKVAVARPASPGPPTPVEPYSPPSHARRAAAANGFDLAMTMAGGWVARGNEGSGFVQAQYQRDAQGHRRVLVRGYEVRVSGGELQISQAYWNGRAWVPIGVPTRRAPVVMRAG